MKLFKIDLILNTNCNLNCSYCFDQFKENDDFLTEECISKRLDEIKLLISETDEIILTVFGGEITLLEKINDVLNKIEEFIQSINNKINIVITSNAIIFSKDLIDFIKRNDSKRVVIDLAISTGFNIKDHNLYRKNSFDIVKQNIKKYYKELRKKIILKIALTEYAIKNPFEHDIFLNEFEKKEIIYDLFLVDDGLDIDIYDYKSFLIYYKKIILDSIINKEWVKIGMDWIFNLIEHNKKQYKNFINIVIDPKGNYHQSYLSFFYKLDCFYNLDDLFYIYSKKISNNEICNTCKFFNKCRGFKKELLFNNFNNDKCREIFHLNNKFSEEIYEYVKNNRDKIDKSFIEYYKKKGYFLRW